MAEETIRKNITLPGMYAKLYKDLERTNEFERRFGDFSKFVQAMLEQFHDSPERVEAEMYEEKADALKEKAEALREELDTKKEAEEVKENDREWLEERLSFLRKKSREEGSVQKAFEKRKQNLVQSYTREFSRINPITLKKRLEDIGEEKGYDVELTT